MDDTLERIVKCIGPKHGAKKQLAEYLGIHPNVITNWLNGRNRSYRHYLDEIAQYFNVSVDYLLTGELSEQKNNPPHANALADLDEPIKTIGYHEPEISPFIDVDALEAKKRREEKKASKQNEENKNDSELDELDKTMLSLFQSLSIIEKCEIITQLKKKST